MAMRTGGCDLLGKGQDTCNECGRYMYDCDGCEDGYPIKHRLKEAINDIFEWFASEHGDITPDQQMEIDACIDKLTVVFNQWREQNEPDYKKGFMILMKYFDSLPDEEKPKINNKLKEAGL